MIVARYKVPETRKSNDPSQRDGVLPRGRSGLQLFDNKFSELLIKRVLPSPMRLCTSNRRHKQVTGSSRLSFFYFQKI